MKIKICFSQKPLGCVNLILYLSFTGHMAKEAAMPIYGKNPLKSTSPEPVERFQRNFKCCIWDSGPLLSVQIMTLC